jgi:hypothetical protein
MNQKKITFVVNGNTYSLAASDPASIREMALADRQQLILLLESVKRQDALAQATVDNLANGANASPTPSQKPADTHKHPPGGVANPERLGAGDIDALMARLAFEEKASRKPAVSRQRIYTIAAGCTAAIIALAVIF